MIFTASVFLAPFSPDLTHDPQLEAFLSLVLIYIIVASIQMNQLLIRRSGPSSGITGQHYRQDILCTVSFELEAGLGNANIEGRRSSRCA